VAHLTPKVLVFLGVLCSGVLASPAPIAKNKVISGRIVAFAGALICLNQNAYWSMIIRVENPKDVGSEFIRIQFSRPCDQAAPEWLNAKSAMRKFRLIREKDFDAVLAEFADCVDESSNKDATNHCLRLPMWKHVPGEEQQKLPFGQLIPAYRFADEPQVPVI
jgi:hypothetical protein